MNALIPFDLETQKAAAAKLVESASLSTLTLAARTLEVTDDVSYEQAINLRTMFATAEKRIADFWEPLAKAANALHKSLTGARAEMMKPYTDGKLLTTQKAERYILGQQRAKRQAEEVLAQAARQTQQALRLEADRLALEGRMRESEQINMQAQMSVAPTLDAAIPKVAGAKTGTKYTGQVTDLIAFAKAIVDGKIDLMQEVKPGDVRPILMVDQVVLNAVVSRQLDGLNWPGIEVKEGVRISSAAIRETMTRTTYATTEDCPRCFGRGAFFKGSTPVLVACPDCRGTGSAVVKQYVDFRVSGEREACAKLIELACPRGAAAIRNRTNEENKQ